MSSTILDGACSNINAKEKKTSFGHNTNMSGLQRNIEPIRSQEYSANNDPLEQIDKIELVQQSDSTVHLIADEEVSTDNNLSCLSIAPIQNLLGVFNENMDENKNKNNSPNGVDQYDAEKSPNGRDEESARKSEDRSNLSETKYERTMKLELPNFELSDKLKLNLPQPVINRCSLYSVIHGVNKAVQDMAAEDQNSNIEETKDEDSALVRAVNGPTKTSSVREGPQVELAVLDEEKFLLTAIENRDEEEMRIRACPATFAEAIGEVEPNVVSEPTFVSNGQSENPLSVLASSRTQLWKPSRSWWEAKSGKNPWIMPYLHNKRWRYLWPLIHYHKFLAKCIKKLKRNNVDVKTSLSPVSAFLREEVCAVSDHLAATSKFSSEEWMEGLPHFHGWTDQDEESQERLNKIVQKLPMRSLMEPADVDSSLLRNQIDVCFLKAMTAQREQMENGGQERNHEDGPNSAEYKGKVRVDAMPNQSFASSTNGNRPPRHGGARGPRYGKMNNSQRFNGPNRQWRNQRGNRMFGGYAPHDQNMMMPPQMQHGIYPPHFNHSFHGSYVPGHYMPPSMNNSIIGWNHPYGGNDYSNLNISVSGEWDQYHGNQYDPSVEHEPSFYVQCDDSVTNTSVASFNHFEGSQYSAQIPPMHTYPQRQASGGSAQTKDQAISNSENGSFDDSTVNAAEHITNSMQTPSKEVPKDNNNVSKMEPPSPSWAHLHMVPGLATPLTQHGAPSGHRMPDVSDRITNNGVNSGMRPNSNWVNAKPLFINPNFNHHFPQGGPVPPSPATQFTMSPQANSQTTAYFGHRYPRPSPAMQQQMNNFAPPTQQTYPETLNETVLNDGQISTEETRSETTSDTEH